MKQGDIVVVIKTQETGEVLNVSNTEVEIKLNNGTNLIKNEDQLRRKKKCVCGMSKSFPACDGSHSGN